MQEKQLLATATLHRSMLTRLRDAGADVDAVVATTAAGVVYLTGFDSMMSDMAEVYRLAAIVTETRTLFVVSAADSAALRERFGAGVEIFAYGDFHLPLEGRPSASLADRCCATFAGALGEAVVAAVPANATLGVEEGGLSDDDWSRLAETAGPRRLVKTGRRLERLRRIKSSGEIELIGKAVNLLEAGIRAAFRRATVGVSERELAAEIAWEVTKGGGVPRSLAVTSGPRTAFVDSFSSDRRLQAGDILRIDLGATYRGYWGDMARTAFVGEPDALQRSRFAAISAGLEAERAVAKAGVRANALFEAAVAATRENGIPDYRRHHCGHGIGVNISEFPVLTADNEAMLEAGMVLCIETPFYSHGWGGMMTEDVVVIGERGCASLVGLSRDIVVVE